MAVCVGKRYGRLVVIERTTDHIYKSGRREARWKCLCDCGNETAVMGGNLSSGNTTSCGCHKLETLGNARRTHGKTRSRLYKVWDGMKERCYNPKNGAFGRYGGRGIEVCDEWKHDFAAFEKWAFDNGYNPLASRGECTLERKNTNGNYAPENCCWATSVEQANNKRNNRLITFSGETKTLAQWSRSTGLPVTTVESRLNKHGWPVEKALTTPKLK